MKVKELFDNSDDISVESYLSKFNIKDPTEYIKGQYVEPTNHYKNIDIAAKTIQYYMVKHKDEHNVYLLVDSDCDGYLSSSMFYSFCHNLSDAKITLLIHDKNPKSHGMDDNEIIEQLKEAEANDIIYIIDAGTNDGKRIKNLTDRHINVVVIDHHNLSDKKSDILPINNNVTLVNNQTEGVENKGLSGCGVAWKVIKRYDEMFHTNYATQYLPYVMITLISDSCPMQYNEQYSFMKWGRKIVHKNLRPFLELNRDDTSHGYSFGMIPNINSMIRLGTKEEKIALFMCLCGESDDYENVIKRCEYYHAKQSRDALKILESADIVSEEKIVIAKIKEKTSMTGLVAGKMVSKYNKPSFLLHDDGKCSSGSMRSPMAIQNELLDSGLFIYIKGHDQAAGVSYLDTNEQKIIEYTNKTLCEPVESVMVSTTVKSLPNELFSFTDEIRPYCTCDIKLPRVHFEPFKPDNVVIYDKVIRIEKGDMKFVLFSPTDSQKEMMNNNNIYVDIIGELGYNVFNGKTTKQVIINKIETEKKERSIEDLF